MRPVKDFHRAVEMLDDGRAAFDPVAGVDVVHAAQLLDRGMMDMAADDAVDVGGALPRVSTFWNAPMKFTAFLTLTFAQDENDQ